MIEMDLIEIMRFLRKPNEPSLNHEAMNRRETDLVNADQPILASAPLK